MKKDIKILLSYISVILLVKFINCLYQIDGFSFAFGISICIIIDILFEIFIND